MPSGCSYQEERFADLRDEIAPLITANHNEVIPDAENRPIEVNWDAYGALADAGFHSFVTARCDGRIAGYMGSFIGPHLYMGDRLFAKNDVIYVAPEFRGKSLMLKLIRYAEGLLRDKYGCEYNVIYLPNSRDFSPLMRRLGYTDIETTYEKRLRAA